MSLSNLIRGKGKGKPVGFATAIPATQPEADAPTVAKIATVAVAKSPQDQPPLTANEEAAIWAWLARIEETDPVILADVMERCQRDAEARAYFIGQAMERLRPVLSVESSCPVQERPVEVRRRCADCRHRRPVEGDEPGAIQRCVVSENGIGYFAFQRHRCEWWDA